MSSIGKAKYPLLDSGVTPGTYALATLIIDRKGRVTAAASAPTTGSGSVVLATSPVITAPTIADLTNMTHIHQGASSGGSLDAAAIGSGTIAALRLGNAVILAPSTGTRNVIQPTADAVALQIKAIGGQTTNIFTVTDGAESPILVAGRQAASGTSGIAVGANAFFATTGTIGFTNKMQIDLNGQTIQSFSSSPLTLNSQGNNVVIGGTGKLVLTAGVLQPSADSTTALKLTKADGTTAVLTIDTTNSLLIVPSGSSASLPGLRFSNGGTNVGLWWDSGSAALRFVYGSGSPLYIDQTGSISTTGSILGAGLTSQVVDSVTTTVTNLIILVHNTSLVSAAGFGTAIVYTGKSSTNNSRNMARVRTEWTDATDASRASKMVLSTYAIGVETDAVTILSDGKVGIGTTSPSGLLDVNDDHIRVRTAKTPATAGAAGNQGDVAWDSSFFYICVTSNTWRRTAHASW